VIDAVIDVIIVTAEIHAIIATTDGNEAHAVQDVHTAINMKNVKGAGRHLHNHLNSLP
jgi:hypothetical protein